MSTEYSKHLYMLEPNSSTISKISYKNVRSSQLLQFSLGVIHLIIFAFKLTNYEKEWAKKTFRLQMFSHIIQHTPTTWSCTHYNTDKLPSPVFSLAATIQLFNSSFKSVLFNYFGQLLREKTSKWHKPDDNDTRIYFSFETCTCGAI